MSHAVIAASPLDVRLQLEVERFLYREAALLDAGRFDEWADLFTADARYEVPIRVTRERRELELDPIGRIFDDTKQTLEIRIERLRTGHAWAEEPPSRTRHVVSNVLIVDDDECGVDEIVVASNLLLYRNRGDEARYDLLSASRRDRLRRVGDGDGDGWGIAHRWVALDQANVASRNLSMFL